MINFKFMPIKYNYSSRKGANIKYLVIHYTANYSKGAGALTHYRYFNATNRNASAHYFVDDKNIIQLVGDSFSAWAVGDGKGKYGITNRNSLSIEMCVNSDSNYAEMYKNTVELAKNLMKRFNIPLQNIVRHYDASRKDCPHNLRANNWQGWYQFLEDIKQPIKIQMDLSKDGQFKEIQQVELDKRVEQVKKEVFKMDKVKVDINGQKKELTGKLINGTNYVAIREVAEMLDLEVGWNQDTQEVVLKK